MRKILLVTAALALALPVLAQAQEAVGASSGPGQSAGPGPGGGVKPVPGTNANQNSAPSGNAAHGKTLFIADGCAECHGTSGEGGVGPHLAPNGPPATLISTYIRHPTGVMPPYAASVVSNADVADIAAYLQTVPAPPKVSSLKELQP